MNEQMIYVDPSEVLADDNTRFNLKKARKDSLKASILESNGVLTPIEIEPLAEPSNGHKYRLTSGFYRHASVDELNKEQGAGLKLPAIVRPVANELERLKHQLAENMERENQSPMDQAVAIKRLLDNGVTRGEVRRIFARPGGRKGNTVAPASNAWLNITLRFLELPKAIQAKIHDGLIGTTAAYELGKVAPDKRAAVIERAEADRLAQIEKEEKDEEKYLAAEKKLTEAQETEAQALSEVDAAKAEIEAAVVMVEDKAAIVKQLRTTPVSEAGPGFKEKLGAAEADLKSAEKIAKGRKNELAKLLTKAKTAAEVAAEQSAKLEAARKAVKSSAKKGVKAVGPEEVKKAAKAEGAGSGIVSLTLSEVKHEIKDLCNSKDCPVRVAAILAAIKGWLDGKTAPKVLLYDLSLITGEAKTAGK